MGEVKKLMELAFNDEMSEADERLLEMLEEQWLYEVAREEREIGKLVRQVH
jgi:hypothetical protein